MATVREDTRQAQEDFDHAAEFEIRFGKKFYGRRLRDIGDTDEGLLYLDWLLSTAWFRDPARKAVTTYLNFGPVAARINEAIERQANEQ